MISNALVQRTKHLYVPIALILAIAITFSASVQEAQWTRHEVSYSSIAILATILGAATAISQFRGRTAAAYHLTLSIIIAAEVVGRFFPFQILRNTEPHTHILQTMNNQIMNVIDRIQYWALAIINRQEIFDTGWLLFCIVVLIWNGLAWFIWTLIRRKRVIEGMVVLGLMLGANINQGAKSTEPLVTFTALTCLLLSFMAFHRMHAEWRRREVDHPDLQADWSGITILLTVTISIFVIVFPIFTTPDGWQKIADFLDRFQIEPIANSNLLPEGQIPTLQRDRITVNTPDMSIIGTPLQEGTDMVMRVRLSDPIPPPPELNIRTTSIPRHYWRSTVYAEYTGSGWIPVEDQSPIDSIPDARTDAPEGRYYLRQRFWIIADHGNVLFAANRPVWGDINVQLVSVGPDDTLATGHTDRYTVSSFAANLSGRELSSAGSSYPDEITDTYLQLPNTISERTRDLAARIAFGAESNYETIKRIEEYLRTNYPYQLDAPPVPERRDAVDYFLFDAPGGFCSHYASAMAVMLRIQGIPARIVTGYSMGEFDYEINEYRVRVNNAHAWTEAYFPGYGWIEFEPTAGLEVFERDFLGEEFDPAVDSEIEDTSIVLPRNLVDTLTRVSLTILGIGGGLLLYRTLAYSRTPAGKKIEALYKNIRRSLRSLGYSASPSTTPNEFLSHFTSSLSMHTQILNALTETTSFYLQARFSELEIPDERASKLQKLWRKTRRQRLTLGMRQFQQRYLSRIMHRPKSDVK
jgi:transglutaminase-like putative cysteine protease